MKKRKIGSETDSRKESEEKPSKILKYLYLGSKIHAKNRSLLSSLGITHIVNCTPPRSVDNEAGCPNYFEKEAALVYKRIPIFDNQGEDILSHMETVINFVEHGKHHGHILVHCHKGISRSASFVIGYLMKKNEMTLEEAVSHVQSIRPTVLPNNSFMEQLRRYEMLLHEQRETEMTMQQSFDERIRGGAQDRDGTRQKKQRLEVSVGPEMNFHAEIGPAMPAPQESATSSQSKEIGPQSDSDLPLEDANFFS